MSRDLKVYTLKVKFLEPMLASSPADPEVYKRFIIDQKQKRIETQLTAAKDASYTSGQGSVALGIRERTEETDVLVEVKGSDNEGVQTLESLTEEELRTLSPEGKEMSGWSVFHRDESADGKGRIFLFDYHLRGFFKSAAEAMTGRSGLSAYKSKIDKWFFVFPRRIYLRDQDGNFITEPTGVLERPVRAMTMQGPRVSLKRSNFVREGTNFECELRILKLGQGEFTQERIDDWIWYGQYQGLGEWRSGSYGRFESTIELKS